MLIQFVSIDSQTEDHPHRDLITRANRTLNNATPRL